MAKKSAKGSGTIRKKTVTRGGKAYTYWEARVTVGRDPGTGKQVQRSFSGKTQKEVREKMQAAAVAVNTGTYTAPQKMTVSQWLDIWTAEYLESVKPSTAAAYNNDIKNHIKPALGAVQLTELHPHMVQIFTNNLKKSSATVRRIYSVLYSALEKAVKLDYITKNPAANCEIPRLEQKEIHPLDDQQITALLNAAKGGSLEYIITVALFTGLRQSELLGLTWDCIDFNTGTININKQLIRPGLKKENGLFIPPKNGKNRTIVSASRVIEIFQLQKCRQAELQLKAGPLWENTHNLIFTNEIGGPLNQICLKTKFNAVVSAAGLQPIRFHDLRHTYAVNAIRSGDDIKTIQGNLGHSHAAFTLDKYGHFTERMKQDSANRMDGFIKNVLNL